MTVSRKRRLERARTFCKRCLLALLRLRIALYSREQTSEKIGAGMSVSRFGDGEFGLALFFAGDSLSALRPAPGAKASPGACRPRPRTARVPARAA